MALYNRAFYSSSSRIYCIKTVLAQPNNIQKFICNKLQSRFTSCINFSSEINLIQTHGIPILLSSKIRKLVELTSNKLKQCWNCKADIPKSDFQPEFFCISCNKVQEPDDNVTYFDIMGLEKSFDIEIQLLSQKYKNLQKLLHPDKFSSKSESEKSFSAQQSSLVNKSYNTLLHPLSRGLYLLKLHGKPLHDGEIQMDFEFLSGIMEINEKLLESNDINEIQIIGRENKKILDELINQLSKFFKDENIEEARYVLAKMKYFANIESKVKDLEHKYGIVH